MELAIPLSPVPPRTPLQSSLKRNRSPSPPSSEASLPGDRVKRSRIDSVVTIFKLPGIDKALAHAQNHDTLQGLDPEDTVVTRRDPLQSNPDHLINANKDNNINQYLLNQMSRYHERVALRVLYEAFYYFCGYVDGHDRPRQDGAPNLASPPTHRVGAPRQQVQGQQGAYLTRYEAVQSESPRLPHCRGSMTTTLRRGG
jgi:hypothetical protein